MFIDCVGEKSNVDVAVEEKAGNNNLKTQQNLKFNSTLMNFLFL
jgi:hypothetical protein